MWWHATFVLFLLAPHSSARLFSEGGTYQLPRSAPSEAQEFAAPPAPQYPPQYYDIEVNNEDALQPEAQGVEEEGRLAGIVDELRQLRSAERDETANKFEIDELAEPLPQDFGGNGANERNEGQLDLDQLARLSQDLKNAATDGSSGNEAPKASQAEVPDVTKTANDQPMTAPKRGQSEYVEFVEPMHSNKLRGVETMEKRVPAVNGGAHGLNVMSGSSNVAFVAFVTMCCVLSVVGAVGGTYYYKYGRNNREDNFDDFTRYSPAGPGRDKQRKGSPRFAENGDESLAYKAQLHHYQQTKQKIIGNEEGLGGAIPVDDATDHSDDECDENNYSVYECPGLAPTGDIEVQNPNFEIKQQP
ncbi:Protein cab-1 [Aphelenchoides avenae]|nr:Protein cab-1 [Aphelenchus avenae]